MEKTLLLKLLTLLAYLLCFVTLSTSSSSSSATVKLINASKLKMFVDDLPNMPKVYGYKVVDGVPKSKSLKIGMFKKKWKFHRDLPPTTVYAYGLNKHKATIPGPTIEALNGISTHVTWQNHLPPNHILPWDPTIPTSLTKTTNGIPTVVHLHGGIHEPESDGNPNSFFTAGFKIKGPTWTKKVISLSK